MLTRVAASHIRVGTFEYFAARNDREAVRQLLDYVIARHYPEARGADVPALAVLEAVIERQASLIAEWLRVGFIHGVMNTDNMAISGETDRLRAVRVHGCLRSEDGLQFHRSCAGGMRMAISPPLRSGISRGSRKPCYR